MKPLELHFRNEAYCAAASLASPPLAFAGSRSQPSPNSRLTGERNGEAALDSVSPQAKAGFHSECSLQPRSCVISSLPETLHRLLFPTLAVASSTPSPDLAARLLQVCVVVLQRCAEKLSAPCWERGMLGTAARAGDFEDEPFGEEQQQTFPRVFLLTRAGAEAAAALHLEAVKALGEERPSPSVADAVSLHKAGAAAAAETEAFEALKLQMRKRKGERGEATASFAELSGACCQTAVVAQIFQNAEISAQAVAAAAAAEVSAAKEKSFCVLGCMYKLRKAPAPNKVARWGGRGVCTAQRVRAAASEGAVLLVASEVDLLCARANDLALLILLCARVEEALASRRNLPFEQGHLQRSGLLVTPPTRRTPQCFEATQRKGDSDLTAGCGEDREEGSGFCGPSWLYAVKELPEEKRPSLAEVASETGQPGSSSRTQAKAQETRGQGWEKILRAVRLIGGGLPQLGVAAADAFSQHLRKAADGAESSSQLVGCASPAAASDSRLQRLGGAAETSPGKAAGQAGRGPFETSFSIPAAGAETEARERDSDSVRRSGATASPSARVAKLLEKRRRRFLARDEAAAQDWSSLGCEAVALRLAALLKKAQKAVGAAVAQPIEKALVAE